ncbi:MAG: hypothetical protein ACYC6Y_28295 [Thermoguttaceae bacterium]
MSLFPFLAVLICTMGSLVLLLVVIARQARLQALEPRHPASDAIRKEIQEELATARLLTDQFDGSREATLSDLEESRFKLGQIEDHTGELRRQLTSLESAWKQLDDLEAGKRSTEQAAESELASLAIRIRQLEREVELAKADAAGREAAYSIVPYEGPNGTRRRPIYIECRGDGLVLQPEGVRFQADDFEGSLDAGNPLDVGLRAVREYLAAQEKLRGAGGSEPYPLLLVRPSGIPYFYAARAAMKSWGNEFGYELVGEDWKLEYPVADPVLQRTIAEAVEPARARQQRLIAAAPSRYGAGSERPVYTVSPYRGGIVSRGGSGDGEDSPAGTLRPGGVAGRYGSRYENTSPGWAEAGDTGAGGVGGQPEGRGPRGVAGPGGPAGGSGQAASGGQERIPRQPGESRGTSGSSNVAGSADISRGPGGPGTSAGGESGLSTPGGSSEMPQSLAKTRGRNWGLPGASQSAVAITRPIRIGCYADRLVIVPEAGLGRPSTVAVSGRMEESIDAFVSAVWDYMDGWGKAGRGMYWRPVLNIYTAVDTELRAAELEALLQDSGLVVSQAGKLPSSP